MRPNHPAFAGRCERHAGDAYAPRCDACAAVGADELAAAQADDAARNAATAATEIRAGRIRSGLAHLELAMKACEAARFESRRVLASAS